MALQEQVLRESERVKDQMLVQAKQQVADAEASFRAHETANAGEDVLVISRDVLDKARIRLTLWKRSKRIL